MLIACPASADEELRSGTWATIRYARRKLKRIYLILPDGTVQEESMPLAVSLDRLIEVGGEPATEDLSFSLLEQDLWNDVGIALMTLPRRERSVLQRYYGASLTLREIGTEMGVSEARACQLHARAIAQLRRMLTMRDATFVAGVA